MDCQRRCLCRNGPMELFSDEGLQVSILVTLIPRMFSVNVFDGIVKYLGSPNTSHSGQRFETQNHTDLSHTCVRVGGRVCTPCAQGIRHFLYILGTCDFGTNKVLILLILTSQYVHQLINDQTINSIASSLSNFTSPPKLFSQFLFNVLMFD